MTPNATITADTTDTGLDATEAASDLAAADGIDDEELLVEEISIDGMCGVY